MRRPLRLAVLAVSSVLGVAIVSAGALYVRGSVRMSRTYDVVPASVEVTVTEQAVSRGRHLATAVTLCTACHGDDLGGAAVFDEPRIATVYGSNLTTGRGGTAAGYSDADYVGAIRHGINRQGRAMMIMHADVYQRLGETDLSAIIAYLRSAAPVDRETPPTEATGLGRIMLALGMFDTEAMPIIPAEVIDHSNPVPAAPAPGTTSEYGRYLAEIALCTMCHGPDLAGGPPLEPGEPPVPSLLPYGTIWNVEQLRSTIRTGVTPSGRALDDDFMPWQSYAGMTDDELSALRAYLASAAQ